jgi:hypothetical protein
VTRWKIHTYRYECDGMKPVTHAKDGREYTQPTSGPCDATAEFVGTSYEADQKARAAGWIICGPDGDLCDPTHGNGN